MSAGHQLNKSMDNRIELLKALTKSESCPDFIGFGNPLSNILVIGKECGKIDGDRISEIMDELFVQQNSMRWKEYLSKDSHPRFNWLDDVPFDQMVERFDPSFAYWGQQNHCNRRSKRNPDKPLTGTSRTWYFYQMLIDLVFSRQKGKTDLLDFQDFCFITELSDISKAMSYIGDSKTTEKSIRHRIDSAFTAPFFQSFPIVFAPCEGYLSKYGLNLKQVFPESAVFTSKQLSMNFTKDYLTAKAHDIKAAMSTLGLI